MHLGSFFLRRRSMRGGKARFVFECTFCSIRGPQGVAGRRLLGRCTKIPLRGEDMRPRRVPSVGRCDSVVLCKSTDSPRTRRRLTRCLRRRGSLGIRLSFFSGEGSSADGSRRTVTCTRLRGTLFFYREGGVPLLFISLGKVVSSVHFLGLLRRDRISFEYVSFP